MSTVKHKPWTFVTSHTQVLLCVVNDPDARLRDIAEVVVMEKRFGNGAPLLLEMLGHRIQFEEPWGDGMGHAQAIRIHPETHLFEGAADPRCDGLALGW